jgi:hypothetical protein
MAIVAGILFTLLCKYRMVVGVFPTIGVPLPSSPTEDLDFGVYNFVVYIPENGCQ